VYLLRLGGGISAISMTLSAQAISNLTEMPEQINYTMHLVGASLLVLAATLNAAIVPRSSSVPQFTVVLQWVLLIAGVFAALAMFSIVEESLDQLLASIVLVILIPLCVTASAVVSITVVIEWIAKAQRDRRKR
jgi:hypothetical protein